MNQIDHIMELADHYAMTFGDNRNDATNRQALRTAIEQAVNACGPGAGCLHKVARIEALQQELATTKESLMVQEPVAWMTHAHEPLPMFHRTYAAAKDWGANPMPLYTAPQPQPKQEPVAYLYTLEYGQTVADTLVSLQQRNYPFGVCGADYLAKNDDGASYVRQTPLYDAPQPQREWVGLTDYEIGVCCTDAAMNKSEMVGGAITFARAIEAKLKEKNGGGV
jgi:hypothetical protein